MPTLSELFNLDPNVERLSLLPRLRGSLPSEKSVMMPDRYMPDVIAPKILYDFIRAIKAPGRAKRGEVLDEEEALNTALNMFGGGLATSGSVPIGALGMSARTAPAGTVPLREIPRSPLGFYSKVEEATLPLQNKGSGGQFLAQIQKTPGVKPEEIEVLGLDTFLQSKPTVTKQEIQDYITANKPDVQEVRLGGATSPYPYRTADEWQGAINRAEARGNWDEAANLNQAWEMAEGFGGAGAPKFSQYTIPGGENYREILLKLPNEWEKPRALQEANSARIRELKEQMHGTSGSDEIRSEISRLHRENTLLQQQISDAPIYKSSHYDQPNILTHLRANDRVIDGKKALFIEEIQSDWHQAGRKKGYQQKSRPVSEINKDLDSVLAELRSKPGVSYAPSEADWAKYPEITSRFDVLEAELAATSKQNRDAVPDAPFKKSWHELALKRAIQEAVDKGYDKLAFTTGKTQAERYKLSKHIDEINVTGRTNALTGEKSKSIALDTVDGQSIRLGVAANGLVDNVNDQTMNHLIGKSLDEVVGKELAKNIMEGGSQTISGKGLEVGGEGQKGFYDEILPKALQNLTKKYGTKVTKSKLDEGSEVWSMDITPQMREQIASKGQPLFATAPPLGLASQDPLEQFLGYQEAENDPLMQFLGYK